MRRERSAVAIRLALPVALASSLYGAALPALGSGAAVRARLPRCAPEGYGLEQGAVPQQTPRPNAVKLTVGWLTEAERRRACRLRTTISLTISAPGGERLEAAWNVDAVRQPWSSIVHTWVWRNWCDTGGPGAVTLEFSDSSGRTVEQLVPDPPACTSPDAPSTVDDLGTGAKYVKAPGPRFPPHILPERAPPPLHWELINPKNAWLVSDGYTLVAVYAGSPGPHPSIGRFAIIRQNAIVGVQYPQDLVTVGPVGAVRITRWPRGRSRETSAQRGRLGFVSANGTRGFLELNGDRVRITRRSSS